jgi:SAM-dependent methyltransferase
MDKGGWHLYRCSPCDHIFVWPLPSAEELARIYSFEAGYQRQGLVTHDDRVPARKFRDSLRQIAHHVPEGALLDVGCSAGEFLHLARNNGFRVQGVELNPDTAAIARANGLPVFVGPLEQADFTPHSFDAVHLGDLIEHVPDPSAVLELVRGLLRPGGVLLIVTPNHDALFPRSTLRLYRWAGIPWSHPTPPFHLNQFSLQSLTGLLERTGFRVVEVRYTPCSLAYELRATGAFGPLKRAWVERRPVRLLRRGAVAAAVGAAYAAVWLLDRAAFLKRRDANMRLVAAPAHR